MVKYKSNENKFSVKERLLKYLIENKTPQSIMTTSKAIFVDYKNTYNIVDKLESEIISKVKMGNTNLINIKLIPNQEIFSVENRWKACRVPVLFSIEGSPDRFLRRF